MADALWYLQRAPGSVIPSKTVPAVPPGSCAQSVLSRVVAVGLFKSKGRGILSSESSGLN